MRFTRFFTWHTKADFERCSVVRCPECGWTGRYNDTRGGSWLGEFDYDDNYCPLCDCVVEEEPTDHRWRLWLWRFVTLWLTRRQMRMWFANRKIEDELGMCHACHGDGLKGIKDCPTCGGKGTQCLR